MSVNNLAYPYGTSGQVLTSTNGTTSWMTPNTSFSSSNNKAIMTIPHGEEKMVLEKEATLEVKGSIKLNGISLEERLGTIEKVLDIPSRDIGLEEKYPKLKKIYNEYMTELEKYKTWERIKDDGNQ